ncbi:MAG: inositol monophosphatase family protein [Pseudomonadota bacterium]|nr:inositol monophosphatase family protein [Pseudomonadota bacterium]
MKPFLNTAIEAARLAGNTIMRHANRVHQLDVRSKSRNEFVSQVDLAAEEAIIDVIKKRYPEHSFLCEESGSRGNSDHIWIIDPLDGTTNYLYGLPIYCVSIALQIKGRTEVGVVYNPHSQELFTAIQGGGAQLDGKRIRMSSRKELEGALIGTGFPYRENDRWMDVYLEQLRAVMEIAGDVRRPGSAALDLSYLASGRMDGFWEFGLMPWDIAAGALILTEAGGLISSMTDDGNYMETGNIIAGSPKIHSQLEKIILPLIK